MIKNQKGQSLVEYLILVALIAVGSIGLVRAIGQNLNIRYAKVVESLGGTVETKNLRADAVTESMVKKKDLRDFMNGSLSRDEK
ncbi:MAG: Flp family type IVb pilin [Proteobacteria bacterium]|jgi:Flp pilus assembly pilin Flp|nr:Flp family type IVb pilin [Pseudomonadota bacterium]